jgi:NADH-quinone oxidoreductase subunit A
MTALVGYMLLFFVVGVGFIFAHLIAGKLIRPAKPDPEKLTIYECGEPTIGSAWVQFDVRFYVVALLFVIFDVEVAFFFPWAVVFGQSNTVASAPADSAQFQVAQRELLAGQPVTPENEAATRSAAGSLARLAFLDILVFFGVLLVGFAYLAARGDLRWVRSLAAEQQATPPAVPPPTPAPAPRELTGAGRS